MLLFLFSFLFLNPAPDHTQREEAACKVFGPVCYVSDQGRADYVVYVEDSEAFADVTVAQMDNRLFADRSGLWFMVENPLEARYRLFVTDRAAFADFSVYFTETESFAGCR